MAQDLGGPADVWKGGKGGNRRGDDQRGKGKGHDDRQRPQQRRDGYGFQPGQPPQPDGGDGQPPQPDGGDGQPPQPDEPRGPVQYMITEDEVWMANTRPQRWKEMPDTWNMPIYGALQEGALTLDGLAPCADDGPEVVYKADFTDIDAVTVQSTKNWKTHELVLYRRVRLQLEAPPAPSHDEAPPASSHGEASDANAATTADDTATADDQEATTVGSATEQQGEFVGDGE